MKITIEQNNKHYDFEIEGTENQIKYAKTLLQDNFFKMIFDTTNKNKREFLLKRSPERIKEWDEKIIKIQQAKQASEIIDILK